MSPSEHGAEDVARQRSPQRQADPLVQRRLWELAQDVSRYLRKHASPAVRLSTALLLAASLAACNASATDTTAVQQQPAVAPLTQEVASGLPRGPGTYQVDPGSVFRDQRGVYQFEWFDPGSPTDVPGHVAHASRIKLLRDDTLSLEIKADEDPILHLPESENVGLIQQAQVGTAQPGRQYYPQPYSMWTPFFVGMMLGNRPAYYDPPRTVIVQQDPSTMGSGSAVPRVSGGSSSETVKPPAQRVTGVQSAVSGRAGGTGAGSAVTNRNLNSGASTGVTSGTSGTTSSSTSGGTSGAAGGTGSSVTAGGSTSGSTTGSSGISSANPNNSSASSSSGVSAPRSGGFSGGTGSSGGSSVS
ncbi:MAG: hypothetical protein AVDCRST_MAG77-4343 [uncultured Chloroflexi bacterium]|uniref:Uncharacterized protein n=1 Tax=uncultured Chloroflexota bacterium TaxID=166587 RepID=A0A6J4JU28_9CHLR|nr:MAG: hypothetical protein AVDCRST_MAG77-4343 [uncultured Chloroflexota bacterium]